MRKVRMVAFLGWLAVSTVWAEPVIPAPSADNVIDNIKGEDISKDEKVLKMVEGKWAKIAWGCPEASTKTCSIAKVADAPSGRPVAQVDSAINQISCFAHSLTGLVPGQWYEVTGYLKTENLTGQGALLQVEFWRKGYSSGTIDSEHFVGTTPWTKVTFHFIAPNKDYNLLVSYWQFGGPGKSWLDDVRIRKIVPPTIDTSKRRVLEGPFWGMFTCFANYLHQYGQQMKDAGIYWQRQGGSALAKEQVEIAERLGMAYEVCFDGMPAPKDPNDPCYPVTNSADYRAYIEGCMKQAKPVHRVWEVYNEPNTNMGWTLAGYSNTMNLAGEIVKKHNPKAVMGTGGFTAPDVGYTEACLKRGADKYLDIIMMHPYGTDEALDSRLFAFAEMCNRNGRADMALAINETGFPTWDAATGYAVNEWFISEKEQAGSVVKLYIQAMAHKLSFVTYLGWNDFDQPKSDQCMNMGLVRVDGSPKPSHRAFVFMTTTIGDRRVAEWTYQPTGTRVYRFTGKKPIWMVWNALKDMNAIIDTGDVEVFPCDIMGTKLTVTPKKGRVEVKATNEPMYLIPVQ